MDNQTFTNWWMSFLKHKKDTNLIRYEKDVLLSYVYHEHNEGAYRWPK